LRSIDTDPIAFRLGQVDALARTVLASPAVYSAEMRTALSLRWLSRAWAHYREDRAIAAGEELAGAECAAQRDAFLILLEGALPRREKPLTAAIRLVRTIAIRPLAAEAAETAAIVADSAGELDWVLEGLADPRLPNEPLARLLALTERFGFSRGDEADPLAATALTPCWAINLAAAADCRPFRLSATPLPCPGVVSRRVFRADRVSEARRDEARESLVAALQATARDIGEVPRAAAAFASAFPSQRRSSRLGQAWLLVYALGGLTPAQLSRALGATKAGAGKLLRQLEAEHLVRGWGPFAPFVCAIGVPVALPEWRHAADHEEDSDSERLPGRSPGKPVTRENEPRDR